MGQGFKREKEHVRFTEDIKMYLNEIFQWGLKNRTKVHPSVVVQNMRVAKNKNGEKKIQSKRKHTYQSNTSVFLKAISNEKNIIKRYK